MALENSEDDEILNWSHTPLMQTSVGPLVGISQRYAQSAFEARPVTVFLRNTIVRHTFWAANSAFPGEAARRHQAEVSLKNMGSAQGYIEMLSGF